MDCIYTMQAGVRISTVVPDDLEPGRLGYRYVSVGTMFDAGHARVAITMEPRKFGG